jgi:copper chaperone CopZ
MGNALKAPDGIEEVSVSTETGEATVCYHEHIVPNAIFRLAIIGAGHDVGSTSVDANVASTVNASNASYW